MRAATAVLALALAGCSASQSGELVFVCESDGELSEQHWGVREAWTRVDYGGMWEILYTDGNRVYYRQHQGETCWAEEAAEEAKP